MGISGADGAVVVATLLLTAGVGLAAGRRAKDARAWLVGERDLPAFAVLLSIVATETSAATFLSVPGKSFGGDLTFLQLGLGYLLGRLVVARLFLPQYFAGDALTVYEVLGRRFGDGVKRASSLLFLVTRNLADGLRLYLTALPLQKLTGWSLGASITTMAAVTVVYTLAGGMRAVVWTDVVQFFVYVAGGVVALAIATGEVEGGLGGVLDHARAQDGLRLFDFSLTLDRSGTFAASVAGGAFLAIATHGADQLMVQRYLAARSQRSAAAALIGSGFVVIAQFALFLLLGLALHAWFAQHLPAAPIAKGDEAFPTFIGERLTATAGAAGLVLGALFAVSMSTLSSSLNASAAAAVNDLLRPSLGRSWSERTTLRVTRGATLAFAAVQVGCGLLGARATSVVDAVLSIASFTTGITLGLFFLAHAWPRPEPGSARWTRQSRAALAAFLIGLAAITAVWRWTPLAWPWYALVGSLATLAIGLVLGGRVARRGSAGTAAEPR